MLTSSAESMNVIIHRLGSGSHSSSGDYIKAGWEE